MNQTLQIACPHCHAVNRLPSARLGDAPRCGGCHRPLFDGHPVALDEAAFTAHAMKSDLPLVVDFWAPWCGPCRAMAPSFAAASLQLQPQVRLAKIDTEAQPMLGARFHIRSIPTMVLFHGGRELARQSGAMSTTDIVSWVRSHL